MRSVSFLLLLAPVVALAGQITGTVMHRERMALPPNAIVTVKLEELGRIDAPARTISEVSFVTGGAQSPFSYSLPFTEASVSAGSFQVRAQIWIGGKLRFASTDAYPVLKNGDLKADILVRAVPAAASLQGTKWILTEVAGKAAIGNQAFFRMDGASGTSGGNTGVNVFNATYTLSGTNLDITTGVQTMIAGSPEMMEQERAFLNALQEATTFRVSGNRLELIGNGQVLARFRAAE